MVFPSARVWVRVVFFSFGWSADTNDQSNRKCRIAERGSPRSPYPPLPISTGLGTCLYMGVIVLKNAICIEQLTYIPNVEYALRVVLGLTEANLNRSNSPTAPGTKGASDAQTHWFSGVSITCSKETATAEIGWWFEDHRDPKLLDRVEQDALT